MSAPSMQPMKDTPKSPQTQIAEFASSEAGSQMTAMAANALGIPVTPGMVKMGSSVAKQYFAEQDKKNTAQQDQQAKPQMP